MSNIYELSSGKQVEAPEAPVQLTPNQQQIVKTVRELLALAEAGQFVALFVAGVHPDLSTGGALSCHSDLIEPLVGAIELRKYTLVSYAMASARFIPVGPDPREEE